LKKKHGGHSEVYNTVGMIGSPPENTSKFAVGQNSNYEAIASSYRNRSLSKIYNNIIINTMQKIWQELERNMNTLRLIF